MEPAEPPSVASEAARPGGARALVGSRWNTCFEQHGRWQVVNSITMRAATVDAELAAELSAGAPLPRTPTVEALLRLGLVATAQDDERQGLGALGRQAWAGPILDLFVIGPVTTLGRSQARQVELILESITSAHRARPLRTVKLRLCGASRALARRNAETLVAVAARCRQLDLELVSLLMGDSLADALDCGDGIADAYFFRWRPVSADQDRDALEAVRGLLRRGKMVAIQLAAGDPAALREHQRWFQTLATDELLMRAPTVAWDVGLDDPERPFFLASVCHREADQVEALAAARGWLTDLGLPLRPALAPFQFHPGCPLLLPEAHLLLPTGRRMLCHDDASASAPSFDPRAASAARAAAQLERACRSCAALPFCLARCPKLPAPLPDSPECEQVRHHARVELQRLLASGQLRPTSLNQATRTMSPSP